MRITLKVSVEFPGSHKTCGISREDIQVYVADAVATMMGCYHPADPILQMKSVEVRGDKLDPIKLEINYAF